MIYVEEQLSFLTFLGNLRGSYMDQFFLFLNLLDTRYFYSALAAFIWIGCSWRWGMRIGFLQIVSGTLMYSLKNFFASPRPYLYEPSLALTHVKDFGFPSGGAVNSLLFCCLLIYYWKSKWAWPIGVGYVLLISFSRMALGVHFPLDVCGGWVVGFLLFFIFIKSVEPLERIVPKYPTRFLCLALVLAMLAFMLVPLPMRYLAVSFAATVAGLYFSIRYHLYLQAPSSLLGCGFLGLFGIATTVLFSSLAYLFPVDAQWSWEIRIVLAGLWITLFASPICKRLFHLKGAL